MTNEYLFNSIFYPRSYTYSDSKDKLINVDKSFNVNTRWFLSNKKFPNILFFHGNAEIAQDYNSIAELYNKNNINLIVSEYRGYGLSNGIPTKDNLHSDSIIIFDQVKKHLSDLNHSTDIIIMGRSLGSASVAHILSCRFQEIKATIVESGFANEYFFLDLMGIDKNTINLNTKDGFENFKKFKEYKKPLLVIHSDEDHIIPLSEANIIFESVKSKHKQLYIARGCNHNNIILMEQETYFKKIKSFIDSI